MTYSLATRRRVRSESANSEHRRSPSLDDVHETLELEPLVVTGEGELLEMEPLVITGSADDHEDEPDVDNLDSLGLPLYLSALLDDLLTAPVAPTGESAALDQPVAQTEAEKTEEGDEGEEEEPVPLDLNAEEGEEEATGQEPLAEAVATEPVTSAEPSAEGEEAAAAPTASAAEPTDADPDAALRQWQAGVSGAGSAIPTPTLGEAGTAHASIAQAGQARGAAHATRRQEIPRRAQAVTPPAPQVESPPPPPSTNPIPAYTQRIEAASSGENRRLPRRDMPALVTRAGGTTPRLDATPVDPRIFQLLLNPDRLALLPDTEAGRRDRALVEQAQRAFSAEINLQPNAVPAAPVSITDQGAPPIQPLPPQLATPVGRVVARLLAQPEDASNRVMRQLKRAAFPNAVLTNDEKFGTVGQTLLPTLRTEMIAELRRVAQAAGVSAAQLDTMVQERQTELEAERLQASGATAQATSTARSTVNTQGEQTLGTITAVRQQLDEEAIRRQEAASGGTDPTVIEARRAQVVSWVRDRVTTEITNFQRQGDSRQQLLDNALHQQENAYNAAAQRDEFRLLNVPTPLSQRPAEEQRRLQDEALQIRNFARDQIQHVRTQINPWKANDVATIRGWRTAIETAGTAAIQAARTWADGRIEEGRSWWERIVQRITGWRERAQEQAIQWEARSTTETRDLIAGDLQYIAQLEQQVRDGATRESLLADQSLRGEQRAIIEAFFAAGANRNPLDIVATRLEVQIAKQQQANATRAFEQDLLAPGTDWHALNLVGAAQRAGFDASVVAGAVHDAVAGWGTNEAKIYSNLAGLTPIQVAAVRRNYEGRYGESIDEALSDDLSDDELRRAELLLEGDQRAADAYALHYAVDQWGTDEETIMGVLRNQTPEQRQAIIAYYNANFDPDLQAALRDDMSGHELDRALALEQGNIAEADAIALDEAMRGGFWPGTDEAQIEATYQNIRNEVLAQAQRERWTSAQMEAEVRRRNREVEAVFNRRYANVEQYRTPDGNGSGSVLARAFRSELSGPELDLANALNENDLARADAARIEIERQSIVYADDEKLNNTMRGQYERALQATRLDEGPERQHQMDATLQAWVLAHPNASADAYSREQMRLQREMDRAMEHSAQARSVVSMQELENVYSNQYNGRNLRVTLEMNMSGDELARARLLVNQGGYLTPYQELDFATRGVGTDEDRLRQSVQGKTRAEIQEIREEWERNHPGENFDNFLSGELSGREEFEIMDTVRHGVPESALERAAQLRRQMSYELDHGALLGGAVATDEANYLRGEMAILNQTARQLTRTDLNDEERERLLFEFNVQATVADEAIQDHERAANRTIDFITQVVGMATAIVVGVVLTIVTGGAAAAVLGPVAIALLSSAAATVATMATKFALKGDDYGIEEIGVDLAVGVVDSIASAATAGVGSAIVGRFLRGAGGVAGQAATSTARAAATSGGNRISQTLSRLATRAARTTGLSRLNQIPIVNRATQSVGRFARSQEGILARAVRGGARETAEQAALRAANERAMSTTTRVLSEIMAESLDNVIQSAPSAFAASVLNDQNWHGNVLLNILSSTGEQVGQGALMGSAMLGGRMAGRGLRAGIGAAGERWRMRTPEGRLAEGSRRMGAAYMDFVADNPAASYNDFLNSSTGRSLRNDLDTRGMLPTAADLDRLPQTRVPGDAVPPPRLVEGEAGTPPPEPRTVAEGGQAAQVPVRAGDAEANVRSVEADAATQPRPVEAEGAAPRAESGASSEAPAVPRSGDPQSEALRGGLPERMRERIPVDVNPNLPETEVRVVPIREDGRVVGVRIEAGAKATPTDVMMHAHVVQGYERYVGLLGRARELIERFNAWFNLQEHAGVGTAAFEARLEIQKLPAVIEERMARLSQGGLDPAAQARLLDEVNSLTRQIEGHHTRLNDFTQGRGYVAAEGLPASRLSEDPEVAAARERYQERTLEQLRLDNQTLRADYDAAVTARAQAETALVGRMGQELEPLQRRRNNAEQRLESVTEAVRDASAGVDAARRAVEDAERRLNRANDPTKTSRRTPMQAEAELQQARNNLTTAEADLATAQSNQARQQRAVQRLQANIDRVSADIRTSPEMKQLEATGARLRESGSEFGGALEAQQARMQERHAELQQRRVEVEQNMQRDLAALGSGNPHPSAEELRLKARVSDLEVELEATTGAGTAARREYLARQIAEGQQQLRVLESSRMNQDAPARQNIRDAAQLETQRLNREIQTLEKEIYPLVAQANEVARSGNWRQQQYGDLGGAAPCFAGGTVVKTPDGDRPIDALAVGDRVLCYDFMRRRVIQRRVSRVWRNWTEQFVKVRIGTETILATGEHPFWDGEAGTWIPARDLHRLSQLRGVHQAALSVDKIGAELGAAPTFNLEIEGAHNFFVGTHGVLVHNESVNLNSKFLRTDLRATTIYVIWDIRQTPPVPLYVGKTYQSVDGRTRFEQHLSEGNDDLEASRKRQWAEMYGRGEVRMEPVKSGAWTEFETAVWEQHYIRKHNGNRDMVPGSNILQNRRNEIAPETYLVYKNAEIRLPDGSIFRHNPCR